MSGFMNGIANLVRSPAKPRGTATGLTPDEPASMQRGTKRKNIYDIDDMEEKLATATPAGRTRSRRSSATPSSAKSRQSASKAKRQSVAKRISAVGGVASETRLNAVAPSNPRSEELPQARAPIADMGGTELFEKKPLPQPEAEPEPELEVTVPPQKSIKDGVPERKPRLSKSTQNKAVVREVAEGQPVEQRAEILLGRKIEEEDVHEIKALIGHKVSEDEPGHILLQVKWVDSAETTWEPEEEIQDGASELLFDYWKKQGGRDGALFQKGSKPVLDEQYYVYKILNHERVRSTFKFHVQWVGYPADANNTSWETEAKLKRCAQELLDEYWAMKGGRDKFLAKRGRAKKARTG